MTIFVLPKLDACSSGWLVDKSGLKSKPKPKRMDFNWKLPTCLQTSKHKYSQITNIDHSSKPCLWPVVHDMARVAVPFVRVRIASKRRCQFLVLYDRVNLISDHNALTWEHSLGWNMRFWKVHIGFHLIWTVFRRIPHFQPPSRNTYKTKMIPPWGPESTYSKSPIIYTKSHIPWLPAFMYYLWCIVRALLHCIIEPNWYSCALTWIIYTKGMFNHIC